MKIKSIKTITNDLTELQHAAVILEENNNEMYSMVWNRLVQRSVTIRADTLKLNGCNRLARDKHGNRERANELAQILSISMGQSSWLWLEAARQAVARRYTEAGVE